jgi:hypothetical protein
MCNLLFSEKINIVCPHRYLLAMLICYHTGELTSGYIREDFTCYSEHFTEVSALKTFSLLGIYPEDIKAIPIKGNSYGRHYIPPAKNLLVIIY